MRFYSDGPNIPNDLLIARDEGKVVFFCGAGVSKAKAGLPDFMKLTEEVIDSLGVPKDHDSRRLLDEIKDINLRIPIPGLISFDRVFGLIEREFIHDDVQQAVARSLKPKSAPDLSAHKILLDLATTPPGQVRLITTNFDRLFEDCGRKLGTFYPPQLPGASFDGIVYLHGRAKKDYSGSEAEGFVLSSSEFGQAYLSGAWATSFIQKIIQDSVVVFVGYTADDLPVQYLLEALGKDKIGESRIFAFQAGEDETTISRWKHKGVTAIPYDNGNRHAALWDTLEAWAERARDPEAWVAKVVEMSRQGPAALKPHERGQVAHIISTSKGAEKFCISENPPPAEWLCVFDKDQRCAQDDYSTDFEIHLDPFELYGLDSDVPPTREPRPQTQEEGIKYLTSRHFKIENNKRKDKDILREAWDGFALNEFDQKEAYDNKHLADLTGDIADLVPRLRLLGFWIAQVCDQPFTVWWAAHKKGLHRTIQRRLSQELRHNKNIPASIYKIWYRLFEFWRSQNENFPDLTPGGRSWAHFYPIRDRIEKNGWNYEIVQQIGKMFETYLKVFPKRLLSIKSLEEDAHSYNDVDIIDYEIYYPSFNIIEEMKNLNIPDKFYRFIIKEIRNVFEFIVTLKDEVDEYNNIYSIPGSPRGGQFELSNLIDYFSELFSQLIKIDKEAAKREFLYWPTDDNGIFARLRIWAAGKNEIVSDQEFCTFFQSLSKGVLWDFDHEKNLLSVLVARWQDLNLEARISIERRLLEGEEHWPHETDEQFQKYKAMSILNYFHYLETQGCEISQDTKTELKKVHQIIPEWQAPDNGMLEPISMRSGWVTTDTGYEALKEVSLSSILEKAEGLNGVSKDFLTENAPFSGLVVAQPVRAFSALSYEAKRGQFRKWAWQQFFSSELWGTTVTEDFPKGISSRFMHLIIRRIVTYPDDKLVSIISPVASWFCRVSHLIEADKTHLFDDIMKKFIGILQRYPESGKSSVIQTEHNAQWIMMAINSPVGAIARGLFKDSRLKKLSVDQSFPEEWLHHVEAFLAFPDNLRLYALVILLPHLSWFHQHNPQWTEAHLLPLFDADFLDQNAIWTGFLSHPQTPSEEIYNFLKEKMLNFATVRRPSNAYNTKKIAGVILAGWVTSSDKDGLRLISDEEMHDVLLSADDEFRKQVLYHFLSWKTEENAAKIWSQELPNFLSVWPKQLKAWSPEISELLCELAISDDEHFPDIVDMILPRIKPVNNVFHITYALNQKENLLVSKYPRPVLKLLKAILPENKQLWESEVSGILQEIVEADDTLRTDEALIKLQDIWNA